jgi:hypothetical protein
MVRRWLARSGIHRQRTAVAEQNHLDLSVLHGDGSNTVAKKGGDGIGYSGLPLGRRGRRKYLIMMGLFSVKHGLRINAIPFFNRNGQTS